jgi:hypothetical protein
MYFVGLPEALIPVRDEVGPTMVNEHTTVLRHPPIIGEWHRSFASLRNGRPLRVSRRPPVDFWRSERGCKEPR